MNTRVHLKYKNIKSSKNGKRYSKHTHTQYVCIHVYVHIYMAICMCRYVSIIQNRLSGKMLKLHMQLLTY